MRSKGTTVIVNQDNPHGFEKALRKFKKKVSENGTIQEIRERQAYVKPTDARKKAKKAAEHRTQRAKAKEQLPRKLF